MESKSEITLVRELLERELPQIKENVNKIERAIYGDPENKVDGLIDYNKRTQDDIHKIESGCTQRVDNLKSEVEEQMKKVKSELSTLTTIKNRILWVVSGFGVGTGITGAGIWELITRMK